MKSSFFVALILVNLLTLLISFGANAIVDMPEHHPDASKLQFTYSKLSTTTPATAKTPYPVSIAFTIPGTTNGYTFLTPTDITKANIIIAPSIPTTADSFNIPVADPTVTSDNDNMTLTVLPVTDIHTEGTVLTNTGTNTVSVDTTITISFAPRYLTDANRRIYFVFLLGCISTPTKPLTTCSNEDVRIVDSFTFNFYVSDRALDYPAPVKVGTFSKNDVMHCFHATGNDSDTHFSSSVGPNIIPTGQLVSCDFQYNIPAELPSGLTSSVLAAMDVIEIDSTVPATLPYGFPTQKILHTHFFNYSYLSFGASPPLEFLSNGPGTTFTAFNPNKKYTIRIRLADASIGFGNFRYFTYPTYRSFLEAREGLGAYLTDNFRIISDCDLYDSCFTTTPRRAACLVDGYETIHRPISDFHCDCNPLFGGKYCEFTWAQRSCDDSGSDYHSYDCYIRTSSNHLHDNTWSQLADSAPCVSITPPVTKDCVESNELIGCAQVHPLPIITASTSPSEYSRLSFGSTMSCAPFGQFTSSFASLVLTVFVVWDTTQTTRKPATDLQVFTNIIASDPTPALRSTVNFALVDPAWFTPPQSVLVNDATIQATDARFYVSLRPMDSKSLITEFYSTLYSVRSACEYYDNLCPTTSNFLECSNLASAPFTPLLDITKANCICRDGYMMNDDGNCVVFSVSEQCPQGIDRETCCIDFPLVPEVKQQCVLYETGTPEITALQVTRKNDHNTQSSNDITLTQGDAITIEWSTIGNTLDTDTNKPAEVFLWLYMTNSRDVDFTTYTIQDENSLKMPDISSILNSYENDKSQYVFDIDNISKIDPKKPIFPFFLKRVSVSDLSSTISLPNIPLSYSSLLVISFQIYNDVTRANEWIYRVNTTQKLHTYPTCLSLSIGSFPDPGDTRFKPTLIPAILGTDICANGYCDVLQGTCQCDPHYLSAVQILPTPNLCQLDVCAGYLNCYQGTCNSQTMVCDCYNGWSGETCNVKNECNSNYQDILNEPLDKFIFSTENNSNLKDLNGKCSRYGFIMEDWSTNECQDNCTCQDGYTNAPFCDKCTIDCKYGSEPDLHNGCKSCQCTRYNTGQFCSCHKLPAYLSIIYPVVDSMDTNQNPLIGEDVVNINNELRTFVLTTIQSYYNQRTEKTVYQETVEPTVQDGGVIAFKITYPGLLHFMETILLDEMDLTDTDSITVTAVRATTTTDLSNLTNDSVQVDVPTNIQIHNIVIEFSFVDDCQVNSENSNMIQILTQAQKFAQNIRRGDAKNQRIWGIYKEYTQYYYEFIAAKKTPNLPTQKDEFVPILPQNLDILYSSRGKTAPKMLDSFAQGSVSKSNHITMLQYDAMYYSCASGNTVPDYNSAKKSHFYYDIVMNDSGKPIRGVENDQIEFKFDMTCFNTNSTAMIVISNIVLFFIAMVTFF